MTLKKMDGVAYASGNRITGSVEYFKSHPDDFGAMVHETDTIEPDPTRHDQYQFYVDAYAETYPQMRGLVHRVSEKVAEQEPVEV